MNLKKMSRKRKAFLDCGIFSILSLIIVVVSFLWIFEPFIFCGSACQEYCFFQKIEGNVANNITGNPISGTYVISFMNYFPYDSCSLSPDPPPLNKIGGIFKTDEDGLWSIPKQTIMGSPCCIEEDYYIKIYKPGYYLYYKKIDKLESMTVKLVPLDQKYDICEQWIELKKLYCSEWKRSPFWNEPILFNETLCEELKNTLNETLAKVIEELCVSGAEF